MDKLEPSVRENVNKMSSLRLSAKLLEFGYDETQIQAMDRGQMMTAYAEILLHHHHLFISGNTAHSQEKTRKADRNRQNTKTHSKHKGT